MEDVGFSQDGGTELPLGSRPASRVTLGSQAMQRPSIPTEADLKHDKRLEALLHNRVYSKFTSNPASVSISGNSTSSIASMSVIPAPACPPIPSKGFLIPVPMKLIPIVKKHFTDRHLRETYRYFKIFVGEQRRAGISEWPEGSTEKTQWREQLVQIGREVRFLGRKEYQKAVQDTITAKCLTMSCGQSPRSWSDYLGALFNRREYGDKRRELVYWIQFGLLKDANNAWIHQQETKWCSEKYQIQIVYDRGWEGNIGNPNIDDSEHGPSFLPFERARGSWFKWYFLKGANEIREHIQQYSLLAHGIYERICISKRLAGEAHMTYTKHTFVHGGGYIAEPLEKKQRMEITAQASTVYTMEGVTAWLRAQGKEVTVMPDSVYMATAINSEVSSLTRTVEESRGSVMASDVSEGIVVQQLVLRTPVTCEVSVPAGETPLMTREILVS